MCGGKPSVIRGAYEVKETAMCGDYVYPSVTGYQLINCWADFHENQLNIQTLLTGVNECLPVCSTFFIHFG